MKKNVKKLLVIFILIISYTIINLICGNEAFAITQTTSIDINSIDSNQYPQIKEMIKSLQEQHPNWKFKILYTDIEWSEVIANEYVGHGASPRNLVPANNSNYGGDWICNACGTKKTYDSGNWYCASESALAYMIDARNSLNKSDIFQFMELTYSECNADTIKNMVKGTFLNNDSYINAIIEAGKAHNVNVYYIVARILQEQGESGSTLSSGKGYNGEYVGYYNIFNIGASGNGKENVILNGLRKAEAKGWTTLEKSIIGGTEIIAKNYIARGQNTMYFQKFDVENSDEELYWHQYMQNILAAQSEGSTLRKTFQKMGTFESEYTFIIPVYKNMPKVASSRPSTTSSNIISTGTELVRVNVNKSLNIRNNPNGNVIVGSIYKDEIVTRLKKADQKIGGTYWDYILKSDGTKGYSARETEENEEKYKLYLVPITTDEADGSNIEDNTNIVKGETIKIDTQNNEVLAIPNATVKELKNIMATDVVVKNAKGELLSENSKMSTGCVINDTYTVAVLGDVNGDGEVKSTDYMAIKNAIMGTKELSEIEKMAADVNGDGNIKSTDYMKIKNYIMGNAKIGL